MNTSYISPSCISELVESLKNATTKSKIISGGTDLIIEINEGKVKPDYLIDVSYIPEIKMIEFSGDTLKIGASSVFSDISSNPLVLEYSPALARAASGVGSKQIRNRGTIGGNLANSSPAGDMLPPLVLLDAAAEIVDPEGNVTTRYVKDIIKNRLKYNEAILNIIIPVKKANQYQAFCKLGSRKAVTIARLSIAACIDIEKGSVVNAKVVLGAIAKQPIISNRAGAILTGKSPSEWDDIDFMEVLSDEVKNAIPGRCSLAYKQDSVKGLGMDVLCEFRKAM